MKRIWGGQSSHGSKTVCGELKSYQLPLGDGKNLSMWFCCKKSKNNTSRMEKWDKGSDADEPKNCSLKSIVTGGFQWSARSEDGLVRKVRVHASRGMLERDFRKFFSWNAGRVGII